MTVNLTDEQKIKVLNGADLYGIMQRILLREHAIDRGKEHLWVVALNIHNRILLIELVGLGSPTGVTADPSDVFAFALQKQAAKIILVHNHPGGEPEPSEQDLLQTSRLLSVGQLVACELHDHLIISETDFYSFRDTGVLAQLAETALDLTFGQADAWKEELEWVKKIAAEREQMHALQLQTKDLEHQLELRDAIRRQQELDKQEFERKALAMARVLLQQGLDAEQVAQLAGLDVERVIDLQAKS